MLGLLVEAGYSVDSNEELADYVIVNTCSFIEKAINELKAGKIEFRVEKAGIVHVPVGKVSFGAEKLLENVNSFIETVKSLRPASAKGKYIEGICVSTTMGPGFKIDPSLMLR